MTIQTILDALSHCPEHAAMIAAEMVRQHLTWNSPGLLAQLSVFHAASVWLPDFAVNIVVSRILFPSPWINFHPTWAGHTLLLTEVFDGNWLASPQTLRLFMGSNSGQMSRNLSFPMFLNISSSGTFEGKTWSTRKHLGKDPRMHLQRTSAGLFEPVVIFSPMITITINGRHQDRQTMGLILIFTNHLTVFMISDAPNFDKNWVLLNMNATHVDLIRALFPLRVVMCDLSSGICMKHNRTCNDRRIGPMRGGTSMIQIKSNLFVGWARTHLIYCSCSNHFYRSHLVIIRKVDETYVLIGISGPFDFGVSGLESPGSLKCQGRDHHLNAIIPSGISAFDQDSMTVLFYRHDRDRILVKICGISDWITQFAQYVVLMDGEHNAGGCAIQAAYNKCRTYPR
jgi:hypothetical protein